LLALKELLKWIEIALIVYMVVDIGRGPANNRGNTHYPLLVMLLLAGLCQAAVGIWQFGLRGTGPEHFLVLGNFYRAYGTFEQPNPYGGYMNLTALLALGMLVGLVVAWWSRGAEEQGEMVNGEWSMVNGQLHHSPLFWFFVGGAAVLGTLGVIFSWSRGAWLGFAAGLATMVLFSTRKRWQGALLLVGGMGLAAVLLFAGMAAGLGPAAAVVERVAGFSEDLRFGDVRGVDINDANYAVLERLAHWQAAMDMARDHLWTGVGFGNYEVAYPAYALINWPDALGHAHNYYLNLLAEIGMLGLLAYLVLWGVVLWQSLFLLQRLPWPERGIVLGLTSSWIALSVHHLVDKLYVNNVYIHLGVMLALLPLLNPGVGRVRTEQRPTTELYPDRGNII
jgi:O-antigen ligase